MLFRETKDWKNFLSLEDEKQLNEILNKVAAYRGAYKNSPDTKMAQIWCALLNSKKENKMIHERLNRIETVFEAIHKTIQKQEQDRLDLIRSLEKF
jgi:DNA-binding FrmR family transcriptional regulator